MCYQHGPLRDAPGSGVEAGLGLRGRREMETLSGLYSSCLGSSLTHPAARSWREPPLPQGGPLMPSRTQGPYFWPAQEQGLRSPLTQPVPGWEMPLPLPDRPSCKLDLRAFPTSADTPLLGPIPLSGFRSPKVTLTLGLGAEGGKAAADDHFAEGLGFGGRAGEGPASALNTRSRLEVLLTDWQCP